MNFYGYGNETTVNQDLDDHEFYLSRPDLFDFNLSFDYLFSDKHYIWAGATYDNSEVKYDPGSILDTLNIENARHRSQMGLNFGYRLDTRDNELTPLKGVFIDFKSLNYPGFFQNEKKYNKMILDARTYIRTDFITTSSFAFRILGENLWGNYPLHMTAFLGGRPNLLGYERQRFAGDALAYGAVGLRSYLFPIKILVPGRFGFSLFAETGRVFYKDEDSNKWHPSTGGGFWMSFLDRQLTISIALANSSEGAVTYFTTGFLF
jgi:outer membrane protein assembly factor BamA